MSLPDSPEFCIHDFLRVVDFSSAFYSPSISPAPSPTSYPAPSPTSYPTPSPALSGITLAETPSSYGTSLPSTPAFVQSKLPRKHNKRKNANHVPRPCNKFILFRNSYIEEHRETLNEIERDHSVLSKMAAKVWNNMTEEDKEPWVDLAKERDTLHKKQNPGYRYAPTRRARSTRRTNRNGRDSPERIEKIAALLCEKRPQKELVASARAIDAELARRQAGARRAEAPQAASSSSAVVGSRSADASGSRAEADPAFVEPRLPSGYCMSPDIASPLYYSDSLTASSSSTPWPSPFTPLSMVPPPMSLLFPSDTEFTTEFTPIVDFPLADQFGFEDFGSGSYSGFFEQGQYMPTPEESLQALFESIRSPVLDSTYWPEPESSAPSS